MVTCSYWHLLGDAAAGAADAAAAGAAGAAATGAAGAAAAGAAGGDEGGTSPQFVRSSSEERHVGGTPTPRRELRRKPPARAVPKRLYFARRSWDAASDATREMELAVESGRGASPSAQRHGCPQSADPEVTARNRRKKTRKAAAQERFFARLETMSEDAKTKDAWGRSYDRYYRHHMLELRQARRSRTASEATGRTNFRARSSRAAAGAAAKERRGQN